MFRKLNWALGAIALSSTGMAYAATDRAATEGVVMGLLAFLMYMIPAVVAVRRKHRNRLSIGLLNFFLGWTFLGWIGALIWACTSNREMA